MKKTFLLILSLMIALLPSLAAASDAPANKQVMPAKKRAEIVATAKALFEPRVQNSLKIGRVSSPFAPIPAK